MLNLLKKRLKKITQKKVNKVYKLCIVGLGNPGSKYNGTRHNVGKDWLIDISQQYFKEFQNKPKYEAEFGESHNAETLWITPSNFVNESGRTISKILRSHNLDTNMFSDEILINLLTREVTISSKKNSQKVKIEKN